jgi:large subunit ribosomal protein L3
VLKPFGLLFCSFFKRKETNFKTMKFLLAKKMNMTQVFSEDGVVLPVTLLSVMPAVVTRVKTKDIDGYNAIQIGAGTQKEKNISKPVAGTLKDIDSKPAIIKEYRTEEIGSYKKGDVVSFEEVNAGDKVTVSSISKGKGFQGVVKRHGFGGGPRSHGQKHSEREPGSIGGGGRAGALTNVASNATSPTP